MNKKYIVFLIISCAAALAVGILCKDYWLSIVTSLIATIYIISLSAGKRFALVFGMGYCVTYGIYSIMNSLYASAAFLFCYLLPAVTVTFIRFDKGEKAGKKPLKALGWMNVLLALVTVFCILYLILKKTDDAQPFFDAMAFSSAAVTGALMVMKRGEFFITNCLTCATYIVMWSLQYIANGEGINVVVLQSIALIASVLGSASYIKRVKVLKEKNILYN